MDSPEELLRRREEAERKAELEKLSVISFDALETEVRKWMLVADKGIIKLMAAVIIANKLKRDPIWIFLIGPSGGGKTEFLTALFDLPDIYPMSNLTPTTFLSGMPGRGDASLLPKINGKVLAFLDWTNLLSMNKDARNEIMGQFRDIYGGYLKKVFGTGKVAEWKGKVGIVACTTPVIDFTQQANASLGERFVHYRIAMPDRKEVARRSLDNGAKQDEMRKALRDAYYSFFKGIKIPEEIPEIPAEAQEKLIAVCNFSTMARSSVIRDFGMKKDVIFVPGSEMPTREVQQLNTIAIGLWIVNGGELKDEDMAIIYKIALDSIPQTNRIVMLQMARGEQQTTAEIATGVGYPTAPIRIYLENLALLHVASRIRGSDSEEGGTADKWTLNPEFTAILKQYEAVSEIWPEEIPKDPEPSQEDSLF